MEVELESRDHADAAATATESPEEVPVLLGARGEILAVGGDDVDRGEIVGAQSVLVPEVSETATEGEPRHSGRGDDAEGCREPERLRLAVDVPQRGTRLDPRRSLLGVDPYAGHRREVDDDPAITDGGSGDVVAAPANRHEEVVLADEVHAVDHVGHARTPEDEPRIPVDDPVPDGSRLVVVRFTRTDHVPGEPRTELLQDPIRQHRPGPLHDAAVLDVQDLEPGDGRLVGRVVGIATLTGSPEGSGRPDGHRPVGDDDVVDRYVHVGGPVRDPGDEPPVRLRSGSGDRISGVVNDEILGTQAIEIVGRVAVPGRIDERSAERFVVGSAFGMDSHCWITRLLVPHRVGRTCPTGAYLIRGSWNECTHRVIVSRSPRTVYTVSHPLRRRCRLEPERVALRSVRERRGIRLGEVYHRDHRSHPEISVADQLTPSLGPELGNL